MSRPPVRIRKTNTARFDEQIDRRIRNANKPVQNTGSGFSAFAQSGPLGGEQPDAPTDPIPSVIQTYTVTVPDGGSTVHWDLGDKDAITHFSGSYRATRGSTVTCGRLDATHDGTTAYGGPTGEMGSGNTGVSVEAGINGITGQFRLSFTDVDLIDSNDTIFKFTFTLTEA